MKYVDEFRDGKLALALAGEIRKTVRRPWTIMEVCGGQTHTIVKEGLDQLLPETVTIVHGPGCPVCVTPTEKIDRAVAIASVSGVIFCSVGDMLRVPGSKESLQTAKANGADVRIVYSPLDALAVARREKNRETVYFAVGFETTAPAHAFALEQARREKLGNFSVLVAHVLVPPAMEAILSSESSRIQGFLAAGHVCTVMGYREYEPLAKKYRVPIVVTGFEPVDILQGILLCLRQLEEGRAEVENQYARSVRREGTEEARKAIGRVFEVVSRKWRGLGEIPSSGLGLREDYAAFDAERRFPVELPPVVEESRCESGLILQGLKKPPECASFGTVCRPENPLGAPMVSSEGACAAYYRYRVREAAK